MVCAYIVFTLILYTDSCTKSTTQNEVIHFYSFPDFGLTVITQFVIIKGIIDFINLIYYNYF